MALCVCLFLFLKNPGIRLTKGKIMVGRRNILFKMKIERKMDDHFINKYLLPKKSYSKIITNARFLMEVKESGAFGFK